MKIIEQIHPDHPTLSFEVFPPKTEERYEAVRSASEKIAALRPAFMSVTYGAGGGTRAYTRKLATHLKDLGVPTLAHLTCVSTSADELEESIRAYEDCGITNLLALRGDMPKDGEICTDFEHASDLIEKIRTVGDFCIGGACYPEGHPEAKNIDADVENLKKKVDAGAQFLTTQMFFDNKLYYNFLYRIREAGIRVPVLAGIMPVTSAVSMRRILEMSGNCYLPLRFRSILDKFGDRPEAMYQAGIAYATDQIIDLVANGVDGIHIYSMNRPEVAKKLCENLTGIIGNSQEHLDERG